MAFWMLEITGKWKSTVKMTSSVKTQKHAPEFECLTKKCSSGCTLSKEKGICKWFRSIKADV